MSIMRAFLRKIERLKSYAFGHGSELKTVYIDTFGACTNRCYMCPERGAAHSSKPMSDDLFEKIIMDLSEMNFSNGLHLYAQNEPLLDKKIFERVRFARKHLPNAQIHLISNLTHVTDEMIDKLLDLPLDRFVHSLYAVTHSSYLAIAHRDNYHSAVQNMIKFSIKWAAKQPYRFSITTLKHVFLPSSEQSFIEHFLDIVPATSTSQSAVLCFPNVMQRPRRRLFFGSCMYSFLKFEDDGKASLCPADPNCETLAGNVMESHVNDIFNSKNAMSLRRQMFWSYGEAKNWCEVCEHSHSILMHILPSFLKQRIKNSTEHYTVYKSTSNTPEDVSRKLDAFQRIFETEDILLAFESYRDNYIKNLRK